MRKGNVLVIVLICLAVTGVVYYQYSEAGKTASRLSGSGNTTAGGGSGIAWKSLEQGLASAKAENKPVLLYFHADWCAYCVKLKKTTFRDKAVLAYLADHFISISVDTDKRRELLNQWQVTGLPTMWFLKPGGDKINKIPGYVDADQMVKFLKYIHAGTYEQVSFHEFIKTL